MQWTLEAGVSKVSIVCIRKTINLTAMVAAGINDMDIKDFSDEACVEFIKAWRFRQLSLRYLLAL